MDVQLDLNLHLLVPELIVAGTALGVILADILFPWERMRRPAGAFAAFGIAVALAVLLVGRPHEATAALRLEAPPGSPFEGMILTQWTVDAFSIFTRALALIGGLLVVLLSFSYTRRMDRGQGEFYALLLLSLLGVMLVSGVSDLLTLFICLELVTITSYVLAAFKRNDPASTEAGLKYLLVGAVSSAALLFGIALVYGAVGEVAFEPIAQAVKAASPSPLLVSGLVLVVAGLLFKVGGVPFHIWIPDVYEGAPSPVTAFLSTCSKAAGLVLLLRLSQAVFLPAAGTAMGPFWVWVLGTIAVVTLLFGIFSAIPQRSIKRLFGYSSIGHAGYLLMGLTALAAAGSEQDVSGATAILYYLLAFFFTNLTAFTVIVLVSGATGSRHDVTSYRGLWRRSPFLAFAMTLALLSLAGVPPLSGFFGKFLILTAVVQKDLIVLAVIGALGVVVSLYFYMLWIREIFVKPPEPVLEDAGVPISPWARVVLGVGMLAIVVMGVYMGPFYAWAEAAARSLVAL